MPTAHFTTILIFDQEMTTGNTYELNIENISDPAGNVADAVNFPFLYNDNDAGDYNGDGVIQSTDYDTWSTEPAAVNVYQPTDGNLDGIIQTTDYDTWFLNKAKIGTIEIQY